MRLWCDQCQLPHDLPEGMVERLIYAHHTDKCLREPGFDWDVDLRVARRIQYDRDEYLVKESLK